MPDTFCSTVLADTINCRVPRVQENMRELRLMKSVHSASESVVFYTSLRKVVKLKSVDKTTGQLNSCVMG